MIIRTRAIIEYKKKIILIKRIRKNQNKYFVLPGGGFEKNLDINIKATIQREIMEELNIYIDIIRIPYIIYEKSNTIQTIFYCKYNRGILKLGTAPEYKIKENGKYKICLVSTKKINKYNLYPAELKNKIINNDYCFDNKIILKV
jgi:ADP-ribose pyrophosphatase YjhB (NUDIX family)